MIIKLSYNLSEQTPFYEGLAKPKLVPIFHFSKGDKWNSFYFTTSNHAGTHVDAPNHFCPKGRPITDYGIDELIFAKPAILELPLGEAELITPDHLSGIHKLSRDSDALVIKSGFGQYRGLAPKTYVDDGPGFSCAAAEYLLRELPQLRVLAVDFISITSAAYVEQGCEAHRVFLGCSGQTRRAILLVEDLFAPEDLVELKKLYVIPIFFDGLDSAACTVFGEL
ncbi:MAG TPA: cyclase [Ktedonobacter sp.]|nr:cyclase [Ktedonobacter sp.]